MLIPDDQRLSVEDLSLSKTPNHLNKGVRQKPLLKSDDLHIVILILFQKGFEGMYEDYYTIVG